MNVRWGIMGTADIAGKLVEAMKAARNADVVAVASRSQQRAEEWAKEQGIERAYGSYDSMLSDSEIDAVYIPLPPSMHSEWGIKTAKAAKHVLSEKPLTMDVMEAERLAEACRKNNVQLMDGVMWVHHHRTKAVKQAITDGVIGDLRRVTAAFSFSWGAEVPTGNIRAQKNLGGGSLGDLGYYCVRGILWAFEEMPHAVYARASYGNGVDMELSGMFSFSDNRTAAMDCGFSMQGRRWLELAGTEAALGMDDFVLPLSTEESSYWISTGKGYREQVGFGPCIQEVEMIEAFSECVQQQTIEKSWIQDALDTTKVCCALAESAESGRVVEL